MIAPLREQPAAVAKPRRIVDAVRKWRGRRYPARRRPTDAGKSPAVTETNLGGRQGCRIVVVQGEDIRARKRLACGHRRSAEYGRRQGGRRGCPSQTIRKG